PVARRARRRGPDPRRRGQPADHQILGRLVEHAASAGLGAAAGRFDHLSDDTHAAADHGGRLHAVVRDLASFRHAQRTPAAARAHLAADARRGREPLMPVMNLGPHASFILAAYAIALAVVAGLIAWIVLDHRAQLRILEDLERAGVSRRSATREEIP